MHTIIKNQNITIKSVWSKRKCNVIPLKHWQHSCHCQNIFNFRTHTTSKYSSTPKVAFVTCSGISSRSARTSAQCGGPRVTELPHNRAPVNRWMLAYIFMTAPTSVIIVKPWNGCGFKKLGQAASAAERKRRELIQSICLGAPLFHRNCGCQDQRGPTTIWLYYI